MWRGAPALLAAAALIAGCGASSGTGERGLLAAYVRQVNAVEAGFVPPLKAVTSAGASFAGAQSQTKPGPLGLRPVAGESGALTRAHGQLVVLTRQLERLAPPPPARHLQALLVLLAHRQTDLTDEVRKLVRFLPGFRAALTPLSPATGRLQTALSSTQALGYGPAGVAAALAVKATALRTFRTRVRGVLGALRRLDPPAVSLPQYTTQVHTLTEMGASAGALATALDQGQSSVAPLLARFDRAAQATGAPAAQRAEIAAIRTYDARIGSLQSLAQQIAEERARLVRTVK